MNQPSTPDGRFTLEGGYTPEKVLDMLNDPDSVGRVTPLALAAEMIERLLDAYAEAHGRAAEMAESPQSESAERMKLLMAKGKTMAKKFSDLRARMSPEAQARAEAHAKIEKRATAEIERLHDGLRNLLRARGWYEGNPDGALVEIETRVQAMLKGTDDVAR